MNAVAIGPFVFAPDRFAAILAIAAFMGLSEVLARKVDSRFSTWAWRATLVFILGARAGHVVQHAESFLQEPIRILYFWQGGFLIPAGVALALLYTAASYRRHLRLLPWTALPAAVAAYVGVFVLQLTAGTPATPLPQSGAYLTLAGEAFNPADMTGKPLVINLWATWCPPCRREMPMMADLAASTDEAALVFINQGETAEAINQFLSAENLQIEHMVLDPMGGFGRHYEAVGLPATLFIDSSGTLQSLHMGEISRELLKSKIARLVEPQD